MVFGGRILSGPRHAYGHGLGVHALAFFDPQTGKWRAASRIPPYRTRAIVQPYTKVQANREKENGVPDPPIKDGEFSAYKYEVPFGGADAQGRAHYFIGRGSVYFDPRTQTWGQARAHVYHAFPADPGSSWVDGTRPSWEGRTLGATATGPDGRMYLVGGRGTPVEKPGRKHVLSGLDIYDPATNSWKRGASMTIARQMHAAAFGGDGKLYVFGGCACRGAIPLSRQGNAEDEKLAHAEAEAQRHSVAETEVYDPATDSWSLAAPMRTPRMLLAAATGADGKIYVIGGKTWLGGKGSSMVEVYDPVTDRWSWGPSLRVARTGHAAVTTGDGTIWVLGGYAEAPKAMEISRLYAGDKGGPTTSVELLKTAPRK